MGSAATPQQTSNNGGPKTNVKYPDGSIESTMQDFVLTNYNKIRNSRRGTERQWYINLAFFFGQQNVVSIPTSANSSGYALTVPKAPPWRVRLVINKIRPIVRKELAVLFGQKPRFDVIPANNDDDSLMAARAAEEAFDWIYTDKNIKEVFRQAGWWACITGIGFTKTWWDKNANDVASNQKGDICAEAVTPFNIFVPNFKEVSLEKQPYVIHATVQDPDWVKRNFPSVGEVETVGTNDNILDDSFLNIKGAQAQSSNKVLVLEMWAKPGAHPRLPNGGMITIVGSHVVQVLDKYPYDHGKYPFDKIENVHSGKFYSTAMVDDLIPLQKEYNRTRSQIIENKNLMSKMKWIAPKGSVDASKMTSEPGQVIFYQPGFQPPVPAQLPALPSYVVETLNMLQADFLEISGKSDQNPQVTSATALSFVQEQDETMLNDTTTSLESATQGMGQKCLGLIGQYWTTARTIKIVGTDGSFDATVLLGKDLRSCTDLRVEAGSALPKSRAAKQAFIMDLIKIQAIPPQQALEMLEIGGVDKIYDEVLADKRHAERENMRMQAGQAVYVNEWDNHALHVQVHNRFRKSQTFEGLPELVKVAFQNHVLMHQSAIIHQQQGDPTGTGTNTAAPPAPNDMGELEPPMPGGNTNAGPVPPDPASISPMPGTPVPVAGG